MQAASWPDAAMTQFFRHGFVTCSQYANAKWPFPSKFSQNSATPDRDHQHKQSRNGPHKSIECGKVARIFGHATFGNVSKPDTSFHNAIMRAQIDLGHLPDLIS